MNTSLYRLQESKNCKKELNYADGQNVDIVPIMTQKDWKASAWLGIITAGLLWMDFRLVAYHVNQKNSLRLKHPQGLALSEFLVTCLGLIISRL